MAQYEPKSIKVLNICQIIKTGDSEEKKLNEYLHGGSENRITAYIILNYIFSHKLTIFPKTLFLHFK